MKIKRFFRFILLVTLSVTLLIPSIALAYEGFLLYTEIDGGDKLSVTNNYVVFTDLTRSDESYLYIDKGDSYFNGDFIIDFDFLFTEGVGATGVASIFSLANLIDDWRGINVANGDMLSILVSPYGSHPNNYSRLSLHELDSGVPYSNTVNYDVDAGSTVYIRVLRNEGVGTYGTCYLYIYSDSERTSLLGSTSLTLHTSKKDYRHYYPIHANNFGDAPWISGSVGLVEITAGGGMTPEVVTNNKGLALGGSLLSGWGSTVNGELLSAGFQLGIESGVYTENITATINQNYFNAVIPDEDLIVGTTYYFQAYAYNGYGVGYGTEKSFLFNPTILILTVDTPVITQTASGNFTMSTLVHVSPHITDNVTFYLSPNYPPYTDNVPVYLSWASDGAFMFTTWNGTYGAYSPLTEDTTYYYQGSAEYDGVSWTSFVGTFTTEAAIIPDKPLVDIIRINDVSIDYNASYVYDITSKMITSNTTSSIISWGVQVSLGALPDGNLLLPYYEFTSTSSALDGTYNIVLMFDNAEWYSGERLYFRAFIKTAYYGYIYSNVLDALPAITTIGGTGETPPDTITTLEDIVRQVKVNLHLTGIMGTWAFMGLCLIVISLLYGIGMMAVPIGISRIAVGIAWLLTSISIVGAFIFTGQLGVWPILILVGGMVMLIMIVLSIKLSGSGQNG